MAIQPVEEIWVTLATECHNFRSLSAARCARSGRIYARKGNVPPKVAFRIALPRLLILLGFRTILAICPANVGERPYQDCQILLRSVRQFCKPLVLIYADMRWTYANFLGPLLITVQGARCPAASHDRARDQWSAQIVHTDVTQRLQLAWAKIAFVGSQGQSGLRDTGANVIAVSENVKNWTFRLSKDSKVLLNDRESNLAEVVRHTPRSLHRQNQDDCDGCSLHPQISTVTTESRSADFSASEDPPRCYPLGGRMNDSQWSEAFSQCSWF